MESNQQQALSLIYLIGMPGAGKSYWARELARVYALPVVDMDERLEQQENDTVASIFAKQGETVFRQKEQGLLEGIAAKEKSIVACGGGTPCYFNNMELMLKSGTVIYLKATIDTLIYHLRNEAHLRPLLAAKDDMVAFLVQLLKERSAVYEKAHYILDANNISITNFAQIIPHV